ncbi:MAG TPA: hypothetical protein VFP32_00905 [Candidatus Saccharimonadales bacterium]|nr:hypothetical protein [Candidatus Saccharimonadales bacterium]
MADELLRRARDAGADREDSDFAHRIAMGRHDAIEGITEQVFGHVTNETATSAESTGEYEVKIDPTGVVKMLDATLNALEARGVVRPSLGITPPDVGNFVDHSIEFLKATELIEKQEGDQ